MPANCGRVKPDFPPAKRRAEKSDRVRERFLASRDHNPIPHPGHRPWTPDRGWAIIPARPHGPPSLTRRVLPMTIPGQPSPSSTLKKALDLLAAGQEKAAEEAVRAAAVQAKSQSGSGSLPLVRAYADMARLHFRAGEYKKAATEFRHACEGPMPPDAAGRKDRLAFMFGFAASLDALGKSEEAEKVFRQCVVFARNLHGPSSAGYAAGLEPLARFLLKTGKHPEAAQLMDEAYDALWKLGDRTITAAIPTRAETLKAAGRADNPFADLAHLPDDLVAETVANTVGRAGTGDGPRVRAVLAAVLKFLAKKDGDAHPATPDTL